MSSAPAEHDARRLTLLYATETGNAQDIADRVARECRRIHIRANVHSLDTYSPHELISEQLVVFVVSTTGSGKEPRAMTPLWTMLLRSDLPEDLFEDLHFSVFGLGDSSYEKFCWPAKLLSRRLGSLGATEFCSRGEGDDQHTLGVDGAFEPWLGQLSSTLLQLLPLSPDTKVLPEIGLPPPRVSLKDAEHGSLENGVDPLETDPRYHDATVLCNRRITMDGWYQDVRHFEFEFEDDIQYAPGDVAVINPVAAPDDVESVLTSLGYANSADTPIIVEHTLLDQSLPENLPRTTTLRSLFTHNLDVNAVPRRSFFVFLRQFATDETEQEKLDEFTSAEGADELYEYCQRPRRTAREVLEEFRSIRVPREYIFDLFPALRPRQFSIASSVKRHPRQVHLCVAIVQYRTRLKLPRKGVCTSYLVQLKQGDRLRVGLQKGLLSLPKDSSVPIVCIGPGTGVAPMRAIVEERVLAASRENTLYFGCRSATKDQHYGAEWAAHAARGDLTYRVACSRDGPEGVQRTYVQHLVCEDAQCLWEILGERGGWAYISGSSNKMPAAVRAAIRNAAQTAGGKTDDEAQEFVSTLEREGRLYEECWS